MICRVIFSSREYRSHMSRRIVEIASLKAAHKLWQVEKHRRNLQAAESGCGSASGSGSGSVLDLSVGLDLDAPSLAFRKTYQNVQFFKGHSKKVINICKN